MTRIDELDRITAAVDSLRYELNYDIDLDELEPPDLMMIEQILDVLDLYKMYLDHVHKKLQ